MSWVDDVVDVRTTSTGTKRLVRRNNGSSSRMSLLWLLFVVLSMLSDGSSDSNSKWETSKIWPALQLELYDASNTHLLQTLSSANWTLHFETPASLVKDDNNEQLERLVSQARKRFAKFLAATGPPKDAPVNPDRAVLSKLPGIWLTVFDPTVTTLQYGVDESYTLQIPHPEENIPNWIELDAPTIYGALRGLETLQQLLEPGWREMEDDTATTDTSSSSNIFVVRHTPLYIQDAPVFAYRGLMIDTSRHFLPLRLILDNLHVMAAHKLNVLHWHLTDSQSWPWRSATFPELSREGAYCSACVYTSRDIAVVLQQAAALGIRVIVEVDLPGHSQAVGASHPEFLSLCNADNSSDHSQGRATTNAMLQREQYRSEPLDVTEPAVLEFVHALYSELASLFPDDWIHLGGDEVSLQCWDHSEKIQTWMAEHNCTATVQVLQYFEQHLIASVTHQLGKRAIVWQDLLDSRVELPKATLIDIWKDWIMVDSLHNYTGAGYDVVVSACWYLDHLSEDWWRFYRCDPRLNLTHHRQRQRVLGGHASMWGERVDETNFYERVWPRASAVAEVLWSGSSSSSSSSNGGNGVSHSLVGGRLVRFRCWLVRRFRIPASPIAPGYCGDGPVDGTAEFQHEEAK